MLSYMLHMYIYILYIDRWIDIPNSPNRSFALLVFKKCIQNMVPPMTNNFNALMYLFIDQ